jgi:hypothetical protein
VARGEARAEVVVRAMTADSQNERGATLGIKIFSGIVDSALGSLNL